MIGQRARAISLLQRTGVAGDQRVGIDGEIVEFHFLRPNTANSHCTHEQEEKSEQVEFRAHGQAASGGASGKHSETRTSQTKHVVEEASVG
mmetsp:Transcript_74470/g.139078  ORF Transcript_74470/g.139078 Transcript_74470/m.139078 type:complete len:91 (-) Transcript_74470:20-292(-)